MWMSFVIVLKFKFISSERNIEGKELTEEEKRISFWQAGKTVICWGKNKTKPIKIAFNM